MSLAHPSKLSGNPIGKKPILEVAHYLKPHGCGMFAMIASRMGVADAGRHSIREQWIGSRKLIVVVSDDDIRKMLDLKIEAGDPEDRLREKIASFRMSL